MRFLYFYLVLFSTTFSCQSQSSNEVKLVGGPCEGCEAIHEFDPTELTGIDTLPAFHQTEPKLKVTGTVYEQDGTTPAGNVIVYIYHTDRDGLYKGSESATGWERRHGRFRGCIRTGDDGRFTFFTFRPASYPGRNEPEHIHFTIKEPGINEYYIDDVVFNDDPLLTDTRREQLQNRGGSGIVSPERNGEIWTISRDIILGRNIPDY